MRRLILCMVGVAGFFIVVMPQVADAAVGRIVTGTDAGPGGPLVKAFASRTQTNVASFFPYTPSFSGGVRVAAGDLNGDGAPDIITGSGVGGGHVKAFSGRDQSELRSFFPYDAGFLGGIFVAAGDVDGDGFDEIITGAGARPHVKVFDGQTGSELASIFAYDTNFRGGVSVAAGDVNGDGYADIITGSGAGARPHIKVIDGTKLSEIHSFFAYEATFTGGVFVGGGDVTGDGFSDIIVGTAVNGHVKVFDGRSGSEVHSFFAFQGFNGGVSVAAGDMDGDGRAEILTGLGSGGPPHVKIFDGVSLKETAKFLAYAPTFTNGVFVAAASVKAPRLEIAIDGSVKGVQLRWPSGCLCELEANADATDSRGWNVLELRTVDEGNRVGLVLPTEEKPRFFRLKCDDQIVR